MARHPAARVAHGHAAEDGRNQVHDALGDGDLLFRNLPVREKLVVLGDDGDHSIPQRQGDLGEREEQRSRDDIAQVMAERLKTGRLKPIWILASSDIS